MRIFALIVALVLLAACGGGSTSGTGGAAATSVASSATASTGGPLACDPGTKACGSACVPVDAPNTGCAAASCDACSYANGEATCAAGKCALAACVQGWTDCDGIATNGCETHTATDPAHCGDCGIVCSFAHAYAHCVNSTCSIGPCLMGYGDCTPEDGCETYLPASDENCGSCAAPCAVGEYCGMSACHSCSETVPLGPGMPSTVTSTFQDSVVWPYKPPHDVLVSSIQIGVTNFTNASWYYVIWSDKNGKPSAPQIANTSPGTSFGNPPLLHVGVTYWLGVAVSTPSAQTFVKVSTVDAANGNVMYFTGATSSFPTPHRDPSMFVVAGTCP